MTGWLRKKKKKSNFLLLWLIWVHPIHTNKPIPLHLNNVSKKTIDIVRSVCTLLIYIASVEELLHDIVIPCVLVHKRHLLNVTNKLFSRPGLELGIYIKAIKLNSVWLNCACCKYHKKTIAGIVDPDLKPQVNAKGVCLFILIGWFVFHYLLLVTSSIESYYCNEWAQTQSKAINHLVLNSLIYV